MPTDVWASNDAEDVFYSHFVRITALQEFGTIFSTDITVLDFRRRVPAESATVAI